VLTKSEIPNPKSAILTPVGFRGLSGWCTGWAGDDTGTVYASFIGRLTALTGIWAAFQDRDVLHLADGELRKLPDVEGARYHTLKTRLPETGWFHMVLLHTQATVHNLPDEDFYVMDDDRRLERFWTMWNRALPLPASPEWAARLWDLGRSYGLIYQLPAQGVQCWKVEADHDAWLRILQIIVRGGV